jgi:iron(III) transport system permease protein
MFRLVAFLAALLPIAPLIMGMFTPSSPYWDYVWRHLLRAYFGETVVLTLGAAAVTLILGVTLAWVMAFHDFKGKIFFEVCLVLPLAIPPYLAAYAYDGLFGYTGLIQSISRNYLELNLAPWLVKIPAQFWAILVFSLTLYPYVYLLTRAFLRHQSASIMENALLLGGGPWRRFFRVGLPLLWPAAGAGAILVSLEVLNDFGVTSYYGLNTFTTAIFAAWFGMGDVDTAIKLALFLLSLVFVALVLRKATLKARRYQIVSSRERRLTPTPTHGVTAVKIIALCSAVSLAGFFAPIGQMTFWLHLSWRESLNQETLAALGYTLAISSVATLIIMVLATGAVNAGRLYVTKLANFLSQGATLGYSIPSAALAIGVISLFIGVERLLTVWWPTLPAKLLTLGSVTLVFAYCSRFFAIGYQAVDSAFAKIGPIYHEASRTLGRGSVVTFGLVDWPLARQSIISGSALVFIDILKELPLGLLLRPFNTETLGTTAYHYAKNEVLEMTALPSFGVILAGVVFLIITRAWEKK